MLCYNICAMTQEEKDKREEERWLKSIKNKFKKFISDLRWDLLNLTETEMSIVTFVMNAKSVGDLPVLVDERLIDHIIEKIKKQFKNFNTKGL